MSSTVVYTHLVSLYNILFNYKVYSKLQIKLSEYLDKNSLDTQNIVVAIKKIVKYNDPKLLLTGSSLYLYRTVVLNDEKLKLLSDFII